MGDWGGRSFPNGRETCHPGATHIRHTMNLTTHQNSRRTAFPNESPHRATPGGSLSGGGVPGALAGRDVPREWGKEKALPQEVEAGLSRTRVHRRTSKEGPAPGTREDTPSGTAASFLPFLHHFPLFKPHITHGTFKLIIIGNIHFKYLYTYKAGRRIIDFLNDQFYKLKSVELSLTEGVLGLPGYSQ